MKHGRTFKAIVRQIPSFKFSAFDLVTIEWLFVCESGKFGTEGVGTGFGKEVEIWEWLESVDAIWE